MQKSSPPNWVADRAKCNLDLAFAALADVIKRDVEEANCLPQSHLRQYTFEVEINQEGTRERIQVRRFPPPRSSGFKTHAVTFEKSEHAIMVSGFPEVKLHVRPRWNPETASCELIVDDQPRKPWQISQDALESLFFLFP